MIAGEASGDRHAAKLAEALRSDFPTREIKFFGSAGQKMRAAGIEAIVEADELAIVGVAEIATALPIFLRAARKLREAATERRPDAVVLVDFPEFNLRMAKSLKKLGFTVVYYISPQLWAWRKYRVKTVRKYVDLMLTILPFEKEWYKQHGFERVEFVGNPLAMDVAAGRTRDEYCSFFGFDPADPIVALLPGSRATEITRILPVMLGSAEKISAANRSVQFVIAASSERSGDIVDAIIRDRPAASAKLNVVSGVTYDTLAAADAAIVTSGTATLEAGILATPMTIVYRTSSLNYLLLRPLISVEHYGLINLIAGRKVVKEMIQGEFSTEAAAVEILRLLDPDVNRKIRAELREATSGLGSGGASSRAARAILDLLESAP